MYISESARKLKDMTDIRNVALGALGDLSNLGCNIMHLIGMVGISVDLNDEVGSCISAAYELEDYFHDSDEMSDEGAIARIDLIINYYLRTIESSRRSAVLSGFMPEFVDMYENLVCVRKYIYENREIAEQQGDCS